MISFLSIIQLIQQNWLELLAVLAGFVYLYCSIKQYIGLWIWGIVSSTLYVFVFFQTRFYAGAILQIYYVAISVYGYLLWYFNRKKAQEDKQLVVRHTGTKRILIISLIISVLTLVVGYLLKCYTNSYVPFSDAFTFAGGLVATWMLARKYLEHWLFWLIIDSFSVVLYSIQHLYLTSILYGVYFIMAVVGYVEWRKTLKENNVA